MVSALFGVQKSTQVKNNSKVVISGYVVSKGNVPFVYPVIRTQDDTEYMIVCKDKVKQTGHFPYLRHSRILQLLNCF